MTGQALETAMITIKSLEGHTISVPESSPVSWRFYHIFKAINDVYVFSDDLKRSIIFFVLLMSIMRPSPALSIKSSFMYSSAVSSKFLLSDNILCIRNSVTELSLPPEIWNWIPVEHVVRPLPVICVRYALTLNR